MKESYWGYWLVLLGIFVVVVMLLANDATTTNTKDYYQLKEVANSALYDSIDYAYYSETKQVRILKEVFVENFLRRFAETVGSTDTYKVQFYDLYESPPKVSIKISTTTAGFVVGRDAANAEGTDDGITNLDVVNSIDLLLEFDGVNRNCSGYHCSEDPDVASYCQYYDVGRGPSGSGGSPSYNGPSGPSGGPSGSQPSNGPSGPSGGSGGTGSVAGDAVAGADDSVDVESLTCSEGEYDEFDVSGLKAYAMVTLKIRENDNGSDGPNSLSPGEEVTVVGKSKRNKYWRIQYNGDKCGWVDSERMAVNLQTYLPKNGATGVRFNITNARSSIYYADDSHTTICHTNGQCINGRQFYTGDYKPIGLYNFAQRLKNAAIQLQNSGKTLIIVDAYRPVGITYFMKDVFTNYLNVHQNTQYAKDITNYRPYPGANKGQSWFLASNASNHNFACAVDVAVAGEDMPTEVHVLNVKAALGKYPKGKANADNLEAIMGQNGLTTIPSEWWHYQYCPNVKNLIPGGANFWNNGFR